MGEAASEGRTSASPGEGSARASALAVLGLVAVAGLVHLPFPFTGDQALFTYAAEQVRHGAVLYRDVWDCKQPGIFLFYLAGGSLFGFRESGIHCFELAVLLGFSVFLQRAHRRWLPSTWPLVPLFTVGAFYAAARAWELTQVEGIVAVPLAVGAWCAIEARGSVARTRTMWVLSGVSGAAVVALKALYLPINLATWGVGLVALRREEGTREFRRALALMLLGFTGPVVVALAYFAVHGLLGEIWWTFVEYPPKALELDPRPLSRLADGLLFFWRSFGWLVVLAVVGVVARVRRGWDRWATALALWLVLAWVLVLSQYWWGYHFLLPLVPLGLFAAAGVEELWIRRRELPRVVAVVVLGVSALLALSPTLHLARKTKTLVTHDLALTGSGRRAFHERWEPAYTEAESALELFDGDASGDGPIYVLGNPIVQYLSGRAQGIPLNGWAPEQWDAKLWRRAGEELLERRPAYVFVDDFSRGYALTRSPETWALVEREYCSVGRYADGQWFALRGSDACLG